ncbi:MAG: 30S ribosomal protein S20 [Candidatus Kerfeldbacteria bacterium]
MPIKKSAIKYLRKTKKRTSRNKAAKSITKDVVKKTREIILGKDKNKASESLKKAIKTLDKAAQNKRIKKNKASRLKSRLTKQVNKLS